MARRVSVKDRVFANAAAALKHAHSLMEAGELSKQEYERLETKLNLKGHAADLDSYLDNTYSRRR